MNKIHWKNERHGYAEASDLGLEPGSFPAEVESDGLKLARSGAVVDAAGAVQVVNYFTVPDGRIVEIYND